MMRLCRRAKLGPLVLVLTLLAATALVGCRESDRPLDAPCDAEDPADCPTLGTPSLNGVWRLAAFRASGSWSKGAQKDAASFLGKRMTINDPDVKLPNGTKCRIVSAGPTIVTDSVETFGSRSGSWERMGFTPISKGLYKVEEVHFDCDEMFWGVIMQPENDVRLLKVWEVYLLMKKIDS